MAQKTQNQGNPETHCVNSADRLAFVHLQGKFVLDVSGKYVVTQKYMYNQTAPNVLDWSQICDHYKTRHS